MNKTPVEAEQANLTSYLLGFGGSIVLTLGAFWLAQNEMSGKIALSRKVLLPTLGALAAVQAITQLVLFLHLGSETRPRWKLVVFLFMLLVVGIIVIGSLWIMGHLNYHMTEHQTNTYLQSQDSL